MKTVLFLFTLMALKAAAIADEGSCNADKIHCDSSSINKLPPLIKQDEERTKFLLDSLKDGKGLSAAALKDRFYNVLSLPLQTVCEKSVKIGGEWLTYCGFLDGDKYVCFDKLQKNLDNGDCLVYSFGIADDWSFEDLMAGLGCEVRAFDPTIDAPEKRGDKISFKKLGLSHFTGKTTVKMNQAGNKAVKAEVVTLKDAIAAFGDEGREIAYLKVDVEGSELKAIPDWVDDGSLSHVTQIGMELHTGPVHLKPEKAAKTYEKLIRAFQKMHTKLGFRLLNYSPNGCVGKGQDPERKYYTYFDVVFYKP